MQSTKQKSFLYSILFLIFLTSSFDIAFNIEIGGLNFRLCQFFMMIFMVYILILSIKRKKLNVSIDMIWLFLWVFITLLFTFNTDVVSFNISYHAWMIFNVIFVFSFYQLNGLKQNKIICLYIDSFIILAFVGIIQFILGILGFQLSTITQWWIQGVLPRINGLCYEPSYYSTYMILGWGICFYLVYFFKDKLDLKLMFNFSVKQVYWLLTLAIVLSSSRMGIVFIVFCELFIKFIYPLKDAKIKKSTVKNCFIFLMFIIILILVIYIINKYIYSLDFLLAGLGINGGTAHSKVERITKMETTLEIFKNHYLFGTGLGGVNVEMAKASGLNPFAVDLSSTTSVNVTTELLLASGIIGFLCFAIYIFKLFKLFNKVDIYTKSLLVSFAFILIMLQMNQNILRPYFWIHLGVILYIKKEGVMEK